MPLIPEELKINEAERGKPRHEPPLRFVPIKSLDNEDGEDEYNKSVTVELNLNHHEGSTLRLH